MFVSLIVCLEWQIFSEKCTSDIFFPINVYNIQPIYDSSTFIITGTLLIFSEELLLIQYWIDITLTYVLVQVLHTLLDLIFQLVKCCSFFTFL